MLTILLHSSKTMRIVDDSMSGVASDMYQPPALLAQARQLAGYVQTLSVEQVMSVMRVSRPMAEKTYHMMSLWGERVSSTLPALDAFLGDIYSGLQVHTLDHDDRQYANEHLIILSGLYGALRALDSIAPYRLEMGYRMPDEPYDNLYRFWGDSLAARLPSGAMAIVNLSAVEYTKALLPYVASTPIISPRFLTTDPKTQEPKFIVVHAKIARGAFARWMISHRIDNPKQLTAFNDLGYGYSEELSTKSVPVYVCESFQGLGLSVRLKQGDTA